MIVKQMTAGSAQIEAAISVLHQWGLRDLPAAKAWVEQFPEGPLRERGQRELTGLEQYQPTMTRLDFRIGFWRRAMERRFIFRVCPI